MFDHALMQRRFIPLVRENVSFVATFGEKISAFDNNALDTPTPMTTRERKRNFYWLRRFGGRWFNKTFCHKTLSGEDKPREASLNDLSP